MTTKAGMNGEIPALLIKPVEKDHEAEKYRKMWEFDEYRKVAPGEQVVTTFLRQAQPKPGDTIIDFGAGTGRGALMLALLGGLDVTMLDFAPNCLDDDVREMLTTQAHRMHWVEADLRKPISVSAKYGFNTDVMEHIPTKDVDAVLRHILKAAQHVFFQISMVDDACGALIGEPLHLTVKPYQWWLDKFKEHDAQIHWAADRGDTALFYVTSWSSANELVALGHVNTESDEIKANIRSAIGKGFEQAVPYMPQETDIMLLGGGPSLAQFEDEIRERRAAGAKLITTNGSYNWCIERGIIPSAQIIVDAREFNNRFVDPVRPGVRYLIASQCHPSVFDAIPKDQVTMWHAAMFDELIEEIDSIYGPKGEAWFPVLGGSTVMLRAIPLLRMLGFKRMEIFGFDSCIMGHDHHAYAQPENDSETVVKVSVGGRVFHCHPWMCSQCQEFVDIMRLMADEVELAVRGDGAIAHIVRTAATPDDFELI
jgi:hypothetical protein